MLAPIMFGSGKNFLAMGQSKATELGPFPLNLKFVDGPPNPSSVRVGPNPRLEINPKYYDGPLN